MKLMTSNPVKLLLLFLGLGLGSVYAAGGAAFDMAFWQKKKDSQWIKTLGGTDFDSARQAGVDAA